MKKIINWYILDKNELDNLYFKIDSSNKEIKALNKKLSVKRLELDNLNKLSKIRKLEFESILNDNKDIIHKLNVALDELNEKVKKLSGAKGGLVKQNNILSEKNNVLKEENKSLKKQLEESMSDKYLVKKIPSGRMPKGAKMKLRKVNLNNQVKKILNEKTIIDEEL